MRRGPIFVAAMVLACLPAVTGLVGNQSFSHSVPVRVPSQARVGPVEKNDVDIRQSPQKQTSPSPTTAARAQGNEPGEDFREHLPRDVIVPSASGPGPSSQAEPSPDAQRGKASSGQLGEDRDFSPIPSQKTQPGTDRESGKEPDGGGSSRNSNQGKDRGSDRSSTGDDTRNRS